MTQDNEPVFGALVLFYHLHHGQKEYLLVQNAKSGNTTLVGGAQEKDETLEETAQREVAEELGVSPEDYRFSPTEVWHEFVFGPNKPERAGRQGRYRIFISSSPLPDPLPHSDEVKRAMWKTKEEALAAIQFPDLKEVFQKAAEAADQSSA